MSRRVSGGWERGGKDLGVKRKQTEKHNCQRKEQLTHYYLLTDLTLHSHWLALTVFANRVLPCYPSTMLPPLPAYLF